MDRLQSSEEQVEFEQDIFRRLCNSERDGGIGSQKLRVPVKAKDIELGNRLGISLSKCTYL